MKNLGIIGGVGWPGTQAFLEDMRQIINHEEWAVRPEVFVHFIPLPVAVEEDLLLHGNTEAFAPFLQESARKLRDTGVGIIILACNTLHVLEPAIRDVLEGTGITFLSLRDVVPDFLQEKGCTRIGLLGTSTTMEKVFTDRLRDRGIEQVNLPASLQAELNATIQRIVTGHDDESDTACIQEAVAFLENEGVHAIVSACTDLTGRIHSTIVPIFDSEKMLVQVTCRALKSE